MKISLVKNVILLSTLFSSHVALANFYIANDTPVPTTAASVVKPVTVKTSQSTASVAKPVTVKTSQSTVSVAKPVTVKTSQAKKVPAPAKTKPHAVNTATTPAKETKISAKNSQNTVKSKPNADKPLPIMPNPMLLPIKRTTGPISHSYTLRNGSLKHNVESIVHQSHWGQLVWSLPYDYRWVGTAHFEGTSLQGVLEKLLARYPVQAIFYEQNHVIQIVPRPSIAYHRPADLNHRPPSLTQREPSQHA